MTMSSALRSLASCAARSAFFRDSMVMPSLLLVAEDFEHRGAAGSAFALHRLAAVLHGLLFSVLHFPFLFALNAIAVCRHEFLLLVEIF